MIHGPCNPSYLGVDVGTESARAVIFDGNGRALARGSASYATRHIQPGWVEQNPYEIWTAVLTAIRAVVTLVPDVEVEACCLASTAVTLVTVDQIGEAFGPALLWMDTRASSEAVEITATDHPALWYTGAAVSAEWMLPKVLWMKRHDSLRYRQAHHIVELHDWLLFRLTGRWALSLSTISGEWSYVSLQGGWQYDLLAALDLGDLPAKWPADILHPGEMLGYLTREVAHATGLPMGLPVAQGLMDSYAAALAANIYEPGRLSLSLGTSSSYLALVESPISNPGLLGPVPDAFGDGTWTIRGGQTSAASVLRWFRDQIAPATTYDELDAESALIPPGCEGLHALDTWQGCRTPFRDPSTRGSFWGLSLKHTRAHLYRALLEAVAYGGRQVVEVMHEAGVKIESIVACGGGSRSPLWMQMHADILGYPIIVLDEPCAVARGAAICASVATGRHRDLRSACKTSVYPCRFYVPDPDHHHVYEEGYRIYRAGYASQSALFTH